MGCIEASSVEIEMAREVVAPIADGAQTDCVAQDEETIRVQLLGTPGWKLSSIVFSREGLRRLWDDPDREVKIEYLQKDIARTARTRSEYRYPHRIAAR
jgi:hypothetical protein